MEDGGEMGLGRREETGSCGETIRNAVLSSSPAYNIRPTITRTYVNKAYLNSATKCDLRSIRSNQCNQSHEGALALNAKCKPRKILRSDPAMPHELQQFN
jgi:hypothetical protein